MFSFQLFSQDVYQQREDRTKWFRDARFGMFIHWGVYAIPARGEWVQTNEHISAENYQKYVDAFNPTEYNPREWARAAKKAGMKYAIMTAKHHDGFCMFDSKYTDYKSVNSPAGRDLIREFVDAFRAEGLKVGFYYSLIDWHHPDYPNVGNHPMNGNKEYSKKKFNWDNYTTYMQNQVSELLTNYGKIDVMWFDYSWAEYSGEKWKATELVRMVKKLQPEIILDNRLGGNIELAKPEEYAGDFEGPEQIIPAHPILDQLGRNVPWEACITLNNDWGYSADNHYKTDKDVIRALVNVVSKNGNLLLNVGPDAKGRIPKKSLDVLSKVGEWMDINSESIYGCGSAPLSKPEWGRFTMKGDTLFAHITDSNMGQYYMPGMKGKICNGKMLSDDREMFIGTYWNGKRSYIDENDVFFNLGPSSNGTYQLDDEIDTVVKFKLSDTKK
ncbi:MAG: alpha-L-fucosidase [Paludibacter sp.]|nr:alpha-L-fucosidase [Paludibacter sp.]